LSAAQGRKHINVVLFSGGSGTRSIVESLLRHSQIRLRILINAYDDGHSTGRLRRFIPTMLGPSDVRKNINRLMPVTERSQVSLQYLSDYRLPVGISSEDALHLLGAIVAGNLADLPLKLREPFGRISVQQADGFRSFLKSFLAYYESAVQKFDFTDCALGNLLFAGCYLQQESDFNRAIEAFSRFYEVAPDALLNVTQGENLFLIAEKEDGTVVLGEADIVAAQSSAKIARLYLVDGKKYLSEIEGAAEPAQGWVSVIQEASRRPYINAAAAEAIAGADVIIYGPGTQHSSLFPSYLTEGIAEAIAANKDADKVFIGNITRDFDIQEDDINDLARKFLNAMRRDSEANVEWKDCVSHFFVQNSEGAARAGDIPFDPAKFMFPVDSVRLRDWESQEGMHSGGFVMDELRQIVQSRIDIELERIQHMVSIVVPMLDEAATIEEVLKSLLVVDFQAFNMTKEIIVVDGGSRDGSSEIARSVRSVRVFSSPDHAGRGAALRVGIEKARGSIIAFFPADREYRTEDLYSLVAAIVQSRFRAVFGTRAIKVRDFSRQLKSVYSGQWGLYLSSKYGGMLLSIVALLLYNRYISDVLTSVKAFDAQLLRSLQLTGNGRDLDTEISSKLGLMHEYILELPVDYSPRTRHAGKKITLRDGLSALSTLFRYRLFPPPAGSTAKIADDSIGAGAGR